MQESDVGICLDGCTAPSLAAPDLSSSCGVRKWSVDGSWIIGLGLESLVPKNAI